MPFSELKLLIVEDDNDEAGFLIAELQRHWRSVKYERVEKEEELINALDKDWDIVLSDYRLPVLDGMEALLIVKERYPELPFILVSGRVSDRIVIEMMEKGADDYILKDNLNRLKPAVEKATARYQLRKAITERDEKLRLQETRFADMIAAAPDALVGMNEEGYITLFNTHAEILWGYKRNEVIGKQMEGLLPLRFREQHILARVEYFTNPAYRQARKSPVERVGLAKDGHEFPVEVSISYFESPTEKLGMMGFRDIRERKLIEKELENTNHQLRELAANLQSIREQERSDIAREIHDELGQQLTALKYDFSNYNKIAFSGAEKSSDEGHKIFGSIDNLINAIRRISSELHPSILDDFGLTEALHWYSREFEKRSGIFCNFVNETDGRHFEKKVSLAVFRIYQEALTNISRHAAATSIESFLSDHNGEIRLSVTDNGRGIIIPELKSKKSLGLVSMKERALSINGFLNIENNQPNSGTTVTVKAPLTPA